MRRSVSTTLTASFTLSSITVETDVLAEVRDSTILREISNE